MDNTILRIKKFFFSLNYTLPISMLSILVVLALSGCGDAGTDQKDTDVPQEKVMEQHAQPISEKAGSDKIKVLNFATFHMGESSDANTTEFDESNQKNQEDAKKIADMISQFKPTIICVEYPMEKDSILNHDYTNYLLNPEESLPEWGEIGLVAFQVGHLNRIQRLYGIDHKMEYNYQIANEINNEIDSVTINTYYDDPFRYNPEIAMDMDTLDLLGKLKLINNPKFLDFLILVNADMLAFAGTKDNFEGADEAAKYYKRNLRIYSNLNRIPMNKDDRVFILSGGSHTAFLNEFMKRSPKYEVVNTFEYLD